MDKKSEHFFNCPLPYENPGIISIAHGGGGKKSRELIEKVFIPAFGNEYLEKMHDGAVVPIPGRRAALTTDSYVIDPHFFPGGDIGSLSIHGTVNDILMCGAEPLYISLAFIIEEGFDFNSLAKICVSIKEAADNAGVKIVTGDTKVVEKGKCDKIFINTTGLGAIRPGINISADNITAGDKIIITGSIGDHTAAVLSAREKFNFESDITSDSAPLTKLILPLIDNCGRIKMMRDPTRGGLSSVLNEIVTDKTFGISIEEKSVPVKQQVNAIFEILGLDPFYAANEGKAVIFVSSASADKALEILKQNKNGKDAAIIGEVTENHPGKVVLHTQYGTNRILDMLSGEQLPRIC